MIGTSKSSQLALILLWLLVSAWVTARFIIASNAGDSWRGAELEHMVDGTAEEPYVHRMLAPFLIKHISEAIPPAQREAINAGLADFAKKPFFAPYFERKPTMQAAWAKESTRYMRLVACLITFASLLGYAFALHRLGESTIQPQLKARMALPLIGLLCVPLFMGSVAYIYDPLVLLLSACSYSCLARRQWRWHLLWFTLACFNKESAVLLLAMFALCAWDLMPPRRYFAFLTVQAAVYAGSLGLAGALFASQPGPFLTTAYMQAQLDVLQHARIWLALAAGIFILTWRWREKPSFAKQGMAVILFMGIAYLLFGKPFEFRVFYDVLPLIALLLTHSVARATFLLVSRGN